MTNTLEPDLAVLKDDLAGLKRDVASLIDHLKIDATAGARSAAGQVDDGARRIFGNVAAEAEHSAGVIGQKIEEQPLVALLIAVGLGYLGGRLLPR